MSMEVVNGYVCRNCTDVEYAKKGVDPARPKDGPDGVNSPEKTRERDEARKAEARSLERGPAVTFGGDLARGDLPPAPVRPAPYVPGATVNLVA